MKVEFFDQENSPVDKSSVAQAASCFLRNGDCTGITQIACRAYDGEQVKLQAPIAMFFMAPHVFASLMPEPDREVLTALLPEWRKEVEAVTGWSDKSLPGQYIEHDNTGRHYWV